jgi:hypothetical protein
MMCVKPNALAKDLELMMECRTNGYPKQCMMRFTEVYSGEMMWDTLKSATFKAFKEQGYTPNLEFQLLVGHIHVVVSTVVSTKAITQCVHFLRTVVMMCLHRGKFDFDERQQEH